MFGWCNDQLCVLLGPSRIYGHYFVSFRPYDNPQCLYAEPVVQFTQVYMIDKNCTGFLEHGNICSYMVSIRYGFQRDFIPCWRIRRNNKPYSLKEHHRRRLQSVISHPKLGHYRTKPRRRPFAWQVIKHA